MGLKRKYLQEIQAYIKIAVDLFISSYSKLLPFESEAQKHEFIYKKLADAINPANKNSWVSQLAQDNIAMEYTTRANSQGRDVNEALYCIWKFCNNQEYLKRSFYDIERFNKNRIPTTCPEDDEVIELTLLDLKDMFVNYIHTESELQPWYDNIIVVMGLVQKDKDDQPNKHEQKVNDEELKAVAVKSDDDSVNTSTDSSTCDNSISTTSEDTGSSGITPDDKGAAPIANNDNTLSLSDDASVDQPAINLEASKHKANVDSQSNDNSETILKMWLSWIKELPEWLQEHYMNSHAIKDLIEYIESSTAKPQDVVTIFNVPKESLDSSSNDIASYQEELAQAKVEQVDIEMPEDITISNWLMNSVPTLHLPTEIATCIVGSFIPNSNDIKYSGNIMPAACIAKFGYDAISSYFLNNYETNDNLIARAIDQISLEA